ncbi:ankyrin repeat domain-containing protein [Rickettsia endosymbiont of Orchestes rusci]|uniref:ankyrin repeat domain-containing protein n=1 Tax=Rickettsia endosymbiont of Orchestes rusci TaxID=3066250 RepID=UPI00313AB36B
MPTKKGNILALHLVVKNGYDKIVKILLDHYTDVYNINKADWVDLYLAVKNGYDKIVKVLLDHYTDVYDINKDDWVDLHIVVHNRYDKIAKILFDIYTYAKPQNRNDWATLYLLVSNEFDEIVKVLWNDNTENDFINAQNRANWTELYSAIRNEYNKILKTFWDNIDSETVIKNVCNESVKKLVDAKETGVYNEIVKILSNCNAYINAGNQDHWIDLFCKIYTAFKEIFNILLLSYNANVNTENQDYWRALVLNINNERKALLDIHTDVNTENHDDGTTLYLAVTNGYDKIVEILLEYYTHDINTIFSTTNQIIRNEFDKIVKILLEHDIDVEATNPNYWKSLYLAVKNKYDKIVNVFFNYSAAPFKNKTIVKNEHDKIVEILLNYCTNVDAENQDDGTALYLAVKNGYDNSVKAFWNSYINFEDQDVWVELYLAVTNGYNKIVKVLLNHSDVDIKKTAVKNVYNEFVKVLLNHNPYIDATNQDIWVELYLAVTNGYNKIVKILFGHYTNVDAKKTALQNRYDKIVKILSDHSNTDTINQNYCKSLYLVVMNRNLEISGMLWDFYAHESNNDWATLCSAVKNGYDKIVKVLLGHDTDVNVIYIDPTNQDWATLYLAVTNGYNKIVKALSNHLFMDINISDNNENTPYSNCEIINLFPSKQQISKTPSLEINATKADGNCFFHAVFGKKNAHSKEYAAEKAAEMRKEWYDFLKQFEAHGLQDSNMPAALKDQLKKIFQFFLNNPKELTNRYEAIERLVAETNEAITKAENEIKELKDEIIKKFQDNEAFKNEIYHIISAARGKADKQAPNISELLNDRISLRNEISNNLEACVLKFDTKLSHDTYNKQYNSQVIADLFLENPEVYKNYLKAIQQNSYYVFFEEIPILSSLANIKIQVYYDDMHKRHIQFDSQEKLRGNYPLKPQIWGNKEEAIISHSDMHFAHASFSDFQQPELREQQVLNARTYTQENTLDIFYKKIKKYKFEKCKIDVEIKKTETNNFVIEELQLARICTSNEGNHILPVSTIFNLIKKFIEISKKNRANDCIKVSEKLLSTFVSSTHIYGEVNDYYNHLRDMMLNKKREELSTISDLKVFLENNLIPFILYVWDNRISSIFYEKRTKEVLGKEGVNIKLVNQKIMTLLNDENSGLQGYKTQIESIRTELFSVIDLPIIVTHELKELKQGYIDQYFNCIMLFLVKKLVVTIKNGTYANTLLYMEELKASIKLLGNLDNHSPLEDLQKIVNIKNKQSTVNIEELIEQVNLYNTENNFILNNIIKILEAIHIENNINEVLQNKTLCFIYSIYIHFIEKKDKSNLSKIQANMKSYKQKLENEQSTVGDDINNEYVLKLQQNLTEILEIIKIWNQYKVGTQLDGNEQHNISNIEKECLEFITYDIIKLLHICMSTIDCKLISHYEFYPKYIKVKNNLLKITECGKELVEHSNISDLRKRILKKFCEDFSDNDSMCLTSDTGTMQDDDPNLSNNDIETQQNMAYSQFILSLMSSPFNFSNNDIMRLMQFKWKEQNVKVFFNKTTLLEYIKTNKLITYIIFIQQDKNNMVNDARVIVTESNEQITEIPIIQDIDKIVLLLEKSSFAEYINYDRLLLPLDFMALVYTLYYRIDKPEDKYIRRDILTVSDSNLSYNTDKSIMVVLSDIVEKHIQQVYLFLDKNKYDDLSCYLKDHTTQIMGKTIEEHFNCFITMNSGFIETLKLDSIIQHCDQHSELQNVKNFIISIQKNSKTNDYKGTYCTEEIGLDFESIKHNIHMICRNINQTVIDIDNNDIQLLFNNTNCLKILGIKDYQDSNHAIVFVKNTNNVSIIDPLNENSSFSNSLEKLANNLLSLGIKFINIIYSGLQQPNSGVCADISLILVKNLTDKLRDVQSVQDIIEIIQDIRIEMYGKASEKNQEAITIKSFDAINTLTKLDSRAVGIQDKEKQQDNYYANNEFINTLQQDAFLIKPVELIGNVL